MIRMGHCVVSHVLSACLLGVVCLCGCDVAATGFKAIQLGRPLPANNQLPGDARRTSFGFGYRRADVLMPYVNGYGLRALIDAEGKVIAKVYVRVQGKPIGVVYDEKLHVIMEMEVPKEWCLPTPPTWWRTTFQRKTLNQAWKSIEKRILWKPHRHGEKPTSSPTGEITSTNMLMQALRADLAGHSGQPSDLPPRCLGLYALLIGRILTKLPSGPATPRYWYGHPGDLERLLAWPRVFSGMDVSGHSWEHHATFPPVTEYWHSAHYIVKNMGNRRIRVELIDIHRDSPFFPDFYAKGRTQPSSTQPKK